MTTTEEINRYSHKNPPITFEESKFDSVSSFNGVFITPDIMMDDRLHIISKCILSLYRQCEDLNLVMHIICDDGTITKHTFNKYVSQLEELGLIKNFHLKSDNNLTSKDLTIKLAGTGKKCEWCGNRNYVLESHHFPIPKCKGGKTTVNICPNCHATFHYLMRTFEKQEIEN